jgi:two-component system cell cycle response regulator
MTARILVVDDVATNRKLLEARLTAEYFDVVTAMSGQEALDICGRAQCDVVLLDVRMPGLDGFEVCRRIKANPASHHIPVILVTGLDRAADKVRGIEAGADDFVTKPVDNIALLARVRSLARLKLLTDELRLRAQTTREIGVSDALRQAMTDEGRDGRVLVVDDRPATAERIARALAGEQQVAVEGDPAAALFRLAEGTFDLAILSLHSRDFDPLRLCGQIRSLERTRNVPVVLVADPEDTERVVRALDIGVNDYILRPLDADELSARVRTQIRRKRYTERLRDNVQLSIELAVTDPLTGLHNRRYLLMHLKTLLESGSRRGGGVSLLLVDIDHFKLINDTHGHDAGDEVLRGFAERLRTATRGVDLCCRYGGEEFVIVMPDASPTVAEAVAERLRQRIAAEPFPVGDGASLRVTISVGIAASEGAAETARALLKRADEALYRAKRDGRNRVVLAAAAAA